MEVLVLEFLTLELMGDEWPASCRSLFTPEDRALSTLWVEVWVSLTAGPIFVEKRTIFAITGNPVPISLLPDPYSR